MRAPRSTPIANSLPRQADHAPGGYSASSAPDSRQNASCRRLRSDRAVFTSASLSSTRLRPTVRGAIHRINFSIELIQSADGSCVCASCECDISSSWWLRRPLRYLLTITTDFRSNSGTISSKAELLRKAPGAVTSLCKKGSPCKKVTADDLSNSMHPLFRCGGIPGKVALAALARAERPSIGSLCRGLCPSSPSTAQLC
jgi:hypothetical protein